MRRQKAHSQLLIWRVRAAVKHGRPLQGKKLSRALRTLPGFPGSWHRAPVQQSPQAQPLKSRS